MRPVPIERALVSVYEKTGIVEFARALAQAGVEVVSTGGTAKLLRESGVKVREVSELTGWPEMLGGRVKTLHPKVHGGILFRRSRPEDGEETRKQGIGAIDLVVVNLYPFEATAARTDISAEDLIENIDIGGPAMVRSAAKNFESVAVVTDPSDYAKLLAEFAESRNWSLKTRLALARKAFATTARYDSLIATELERLQAADGSVTLAERPEFPAQLHLDLSRHASQRYGENPHQKSALYIPSGAPAAARRSAASASASAFSEQRLTTALIRGFTAAMRSRCQATTSRADSSRWRIAAARSRAVHHNSEPEADDELVTMLRSSRTQIPLGVPILRHGSRASGCH